MPKPARYRLTQLFSGTEPDRADSPMLRLPGDILELEVSGLTGTSESGCGWYTPRSGPGSSEARFQGAPSCRK